jgi:formate C-acetyltransferase
MSKFEGDCYMTDRVANIYRRVVGKEHHSYRQNITIDLAQDFSSRCLSPLQRSIERTVTMLNNEKAVIFKDEKIAFMRTLNVNPAIFTEQEWQKIKETHYIHELGTVCNICPDYSKIIGSGLEQTRQYAQDQIHSPQNTTQDSLEFYKGVIRIIDAVYSLTDRYCREAENQGNETVAGMLVQIPRYGARTFTEALQFFRILHFTLWCEGEYHNTIGRFDQYMYPYFIADIEDGRLDHDGAFEILEEFFLSFNKDSDIYPGIQQGDNGQSIVLGGVDENGKPAFNALSAMCLKASKELKIIDPKINIRVDKSTPANIYEMGTELTKEGLGFPQYSNDDVVIQGLVGMGYDLKDARNYVVAACWEFIIPGYGMDIPNIGAISFPKVVDKIMRGCLMRCETFDEFLTQFYLGIEHECDEIIKQFKNVWMVPAPFMSIMMSGCLEKGCDISFGGKYNNFGLHGSGISTAADSLIAIKKTVFDEKTVEAGELIKAIDANFEGYDKILHLLRFDSPKMGNDDEDVDRFAVKMLDVFADALFGRKNERGGCFRAGTGSAMYYLWHAGEIGASADGRRSGEPFGANFSPSLFVRNKGPISVIKSFTKPHLVRTINGGPLTMEFYSSLFSDEDSVKKVASLVKQFVDRGGHQLQLNAVNRETLLDALKHPENHANLIVRVWGWSAYFVELDSDYQNHIIKRQEYD